MTEIEISEDCKGCHMHITYGYTLDCQRNFKYEVCPCSMCLVKTMCRFICDSYREFANAAKRNRSKDLIT